MPIAMVLAGNAMKDERIVKRTDNDHTDEVGVEIGQSGTLAVLGRADHGEQHRYARPDIHAENHRQAGVIGDAAGQADRLQNTDAGRATLHHRRDENPRQHTERRIVVEAEENTLETGILGQGFHRGTDHVHGEQERTEPDQYHADFLTGVFAPDEPHADPDDDEGGEQHFGREEAPDGAVVGTGKRQEPRGHRGTDVCAEYDADRL